MAGPLFNMGTFFREIDNTSVDIEDLYYMLQMVPLVKEKDDAVDFEYKQGLITFENLGFRHLSLDDKNKIDSESNDKELLF